MNLAHIFSESSVTVQITMLILISMSIVSWAIIIWKSYFLIKESNKIKIATTIIQTKNFSRAISEIEDGSIGTKIAKFINKIDSYYPANIQKNQFVDAKERATVTLDSMLFSYDNYIRKGCSTLSTIASSAPYIGLFGTVVGILGSFQGLATARIVTLQTVAPGIVEALVATSIGLATAIPALIAAHSLTRAANRIMGTLSLTQNQILISLHAAHKSKKGQE